MGKSFQFMLLLMIVAILVCLSLWIIAAIGAMKLTDGCLLRYSANEAGMALNADNVSNTVNLKANANYSFTTGGNATSGLQVDESGYGKWLNTNFSVKDGQVVKFAIKGEVSLCQAYLPINNLQSNSDKDAGGKRIPIPRTEDKSADPVALPLDAKIGEWRNLTEIYPNDHYVVSIMPDQKTTLPSISMKDWFSDGVFTADCRDGKTSYSPICGRFSFWGGQGGTYVSSCAWEPQCTKCNCHDVCDSFDLLGVCLTGWHNECDWCGCYKAVNSPVPEPYVSSGTFTSPWRASLADLFQNFAPDCASQSTYILGQYQNERFFWFSADNAAALLYRMDSSATPTNANVRGSNFTIAAIAADQSYHKNGEAYKVLINKTHTGSNIEYLQFRLADTDGNWADNTGGYVLNITQTKCRRANGNGIDDSIQGRGIVEYVLMPYGQNPNDSGSVTAQSISVDNEGNGEITIPNNKAGYLWLKIKNNPSDYKDSFGQYQVQFLSQLPTNDFFGNILNPIFVMLKTKIMDASQTIFKNMICYQGIGSSVGDHSNCTNFFNYIKGLLTLYIMGYGFMFLLGIVQISQTDLVIRVIKIGLVAGLMNESTFEFFNNYVFHFVTGFSDSIISNMSGYSLFVGENSSGTSITNPFTFLTALLTKIFLSKTFAAQMMAMIAMGINGVLYFIITFVTLIMLIVVAFRAIAVYLMAFVAIAVLIGIAPLFLTFMLFEFTFYLFDNWIKFTVRYMLEPVIMMAGIIVLTQLFTIYLDYVTGYSVCWKCALPIQIPFPTIPGFNPAFLNVPMFCINWFAPWGFDHFSGVMGINIQHIIALMIIAYCLWGYIDFAGNVTGRLAGSAGGPSATSMGGSMSGAIEQKALKQVGLDANSRAQIKAGAKERLANLSKGANRTPLEKGNRHDVKSPEAGGESGASKGEAAKTEAKPTTTSTPTSEQKAQTATSGGSDKKPSSFQAMGRQRSAAMSSGSDQKSSVQQPSSPPDAGRQRSAAMSSGSDQKSSVQQPSSPPDAGRQRSASVGSSPQSGASNAQRPSSFQAMGRARSASVGSTTQPSSASKTATLDSLKAQRATLVGGAPTAAERLDNTNKNNPGAQPSAQSSTEKTTGTAQGALGERKDSTKTPQQGDSKKDNTNQLGKNDQGQVTPTSEKPTGTNQGAQGERKNSVDTSKTDNAKGNNPKPDVTASKEPEKTDSKKDQKDK